MPTREELIQSLDSRLSHNQRVHKGVAWRGGIKSWQKATTTTDGDDFARLPKRLQELIAKQEARDDAELQAFAAEQRELVKAEHPGRRSPRTRMEILTKQLIDECERTTAVYGTPVLPVSMTREIAGESWKVGEPLTVAQIEEYTKRTLERVARDHTKVYGHRNEGVSVVGGVAQ